MGNNMGKKSFMENIDGNIQTRGACLGICPIACKNAAKMMCSCSGATAKTTSYNSEYNYYHMMNALSSND